MGEYRKEKQLGRGTYGTVYLASKNASNLSVEDSTSTPERDELVAIKRLYTDTSKHVGILCLRELEMTTNCSHPNVVSALGILHSSPFRSLSPRKGYRTDKIYLELPLALCDMEKLIEDHFIKVDELKDALVQITRGLHYLHSNGIMHRDLKPNNILVYASEDNKSFYFKLTDLGAAKPCSIAARSTPKLFYIEYRAPELLLEVERYNQAVDIWALGCIFVEVITGSSPFPAPKSVSNRAQLKRIISVLGHSSELEEISGQTLELSKRVSGLSSVIKTTRKKEFDKSNGPSWNAWFEMVKKMLALAPSERATASDVLELFGETPPTYSTSTPITIRDCPCRTTALQLLRGCKLKSRYHHHCVDLINRLTYTSNHDPKKLVVVVISIVSKYWDIEFASSLGKLVNFKYTLPTAELEEYELRIVRDLLDYRIYRPLLSDLVSIKVPRKAIDEMEESVSVNGLIVEQLAATMNERWSS